jgi:hypothetical protein
MELHHQKQLAEMMSFYLRLLQAIFCCICTYVLSKGRGENSRYVGYGTVVIVRRAMRNQPSED